MAVWTYLWDIPFDKNTLLGKKDFGTTVWASCDSILGCSYVDDRLVEFVTDLMRIADGFQPADNHRHSFLPCQHLHGLLQHPL